MLCFDFCSPCLLKSICLCFGFLLDRISFLQIGQGTYSSVYKARDLINKKVVALKRVRFDIKDPESVKFMAREILILRRLEHPNIIKLEGLVTSRASCSLYLVFEYMEHDLTGLASLPGVKFSEQQVLIQLLFSIENLINSVLWQLHSVTCMIITCL